MVFKKQYNESDVIAAIKYQNDVATVTLIKEYMGCSVNTANALLADLLKTGDVRRKNGGTEAKPNWIYSRTAKAIQR